MVASNHDSDGVLRHKKGIWESKEKNKKANKQKRKPTYKYFCDCGPEVNKIDKIKGKTSFGYSSELNA